MRLGGLVCWSVIYDVVVMGAVRGAWFPGAVYVACVEFFMWVGGGVGGVSCGG